ncbi:hypothetical protein FFI94_024125 [Rhodococcus sp. KBS0724]|nr:hypothetical protein FFI94_024125 [Rhodococcus sp. KBS0724]
MATLVSDFDTRQKKNYQPVLGHQKTYANFCRANAHESATQLAVGDSMVANRLGGQNLTIDNV